MSVNQSFNLVASALPEGEYLGEVLRFPEFSTFGDDLDFLTQRLARLAERCWGFDALGQWPRRIKPSDAEVRYVEFDVAPKRDVIGWEQPLPVRLAVVVWRETERQLIGYLPALSLEVVGRTETELLDRAKSYTRLLLNRMKLSTDPQLWVHLARLAEVEVRPFEIEVDRLTALEAAKRALNDEDEKKKSELERAASNLDELKLNPAYEIEPTLNRLTDALTSSHARSVLLIGPSGIGKTAAVHELVRRRDQFKLGARPIWQTDGPRLVAGMTGFGMWQERCKKIVDEARKTNAIVFLGNLVELMQVGQHEGNEQGIANFLKPYLLRGDLLAIAECTVEQRDLIEMRDPHLLSMFEEITLQEPDGPQRARILSAVAAEHLKVGADPVDADALRQLDHLHQRFATYSVAPGRQVRFLTNLMQSDRAASLDAPAVTQAFARETGLPLFMIDDDTPLDAAKARAWLADRVIGQPEAVKRVIDVIAVVKANLARPARPIGSFLFVGPTGVGKTQMAKSIAEYLFGDADRLTRFDMSEYHDLTSVIRLTQAPCNEQGIAGEGLLTAKVREQPFCVLLFDEFEKAHPAFFDLLLQVLGEGRLTDGAGRLADFSNAVIIMTSNLGAASWRTDGFGFSPGGQAGHDEHFIEAVRDHLRPELFNRIDRTVPFQPLSREQVRAIVVRELDGVRRRDGLAMRGVELHVDDAAIDHLVEQGYDINLGARPIQRTIEQLILAPLADRINKFGNDTPLVAQTVMQDGALNVDVRAVPRGSAEGTPSRASSPIVHRLEEVTRLRRLVQRFVGCSAVLELRNERERLHRLQQYTLRRKKKTSQYDPLLKALPRLEALLDQIHRCKDRIQSNEDALAMQLYNGVDAVGAVEAETYETVHDAWRSTLLDVYCRRFRAANEVLIGLYADAAMPIGTLIESYVAAARAEGATVESARVFTWTVGKDKRPADGVALRLMSKAAGEKRPTEFERGDQVVWRSATAPVMAALPAFGGERDIGIVLRVRGPYVAALFSAEVGVHKFRSKSRRVQACLVHVDGCGLDQYEPPSGVDCVLDFLLEEGEIRRVYDGRSATVDDKVLSKRTGWSLDRCAATLPSLISQAREKLLKEMIDA